VGPGCKTPCSVSIPAPEGGFSVTYALANYQPATVAVNVIKNPGDFSTPASAVTDPNPVFAELQAATPPKPHKMHPRKPKKPMTAAAPAPADSAFPNPNAAPPPPLAQSR
jgi:hypothetical protein